MKYSIPLAIALLLTACVAVPVERNFPSVPEDLKQKCSSLQEVPNDVTKLSEVLLVVTSNYALYHECALKVDTWNEWYKTQKDLYEK